MSECDNQTHSRRFADVFLYLGLTSLAIGISFFFGFFFSFLYWEIESLKYSEVFLIGAAGWLIVGVILIAWWLKRTYRS